MQIEYVEKRLSRSDPDRGIVAMQSNLLNQRDEVVVEQRGLIQVRCR